jgi:hypothetical protein
MIAKGLFLLFKPDVPFGSRTTTVPAMTAAATFLPDGGGGTTGTASAAVAVAVAVSTVAVAVSTVSTVAVAVAVAVAVSLAVAVGVIFIWELRFCREKKKKSGEGTLDKIDIFFFL